jgi:hypothetical protein
MISSNGLPYSLRSAVLFPETLSDRTAPLEFGRIAYGRPGHSPDQDFMFFGIAGWSAINDDFISHLQSELRHSTFGQLCTAAPFTAPTRRLAVFSDNFDIDKGMGVSNIKLNHLSFDRDSLISI